MIKANKKSIPNLDFTDHNTLYATHGLHAYAAKCPPQLVKFGIENYSYLNQWIQRDPIIPNPYIPADLNRYSYVRNNPIRYTDPSGMCIDENLDGRCDNISTLQPQIISRQAWGALEPGIHYICGVYGMQGNCIATTGLSEGRYDPEHNPDGYAYYSELQPGVPLAAILFRITVHHEGNNQTNDIKQVQYGHMRRRGYYDIAYHFAIDQDGNIFEGRDISVRGANVLGANTGNIGLLLFGDFQPGPRLTVCGVTIWQDDDDLGPSEQQVEQSLALIRWLDMKYGIEEVVGHRDLNDTECPGDYCVPYIKLFNEAVQ